MKDSDIGKLIFGAIVGMFAADILKGTFDPPKAPTSPIWVPSIPIGYSLGNLFPRNEITITKDNTMEENSE